MSQNTSGIRSSNIRRNIKSNIKSNMKSEIAKKHISNIEKQNEDLMGSLLKMDDPDFGKNEPIKARRTEPPKRSREDRKVSPAQAMLDQRLNRQGRQRLSLQVSEQVRQPNQQARFRKAKGGERLLYQQKQHQRQQEYQPEHQQEEEPK